MRRIVIIAHNLRSTHNIGSLLRTAEGLGVEKIYLTGYTPYPSHESDSRLPHLSAKISAAIHKTALGAEDNIDWEYKQDIHEVIEQLKQAGFTLMALEQSSSASALQDLHTKDPVALLLGSEVTGIDKDLLKLITTHIEIPMFGKKESFNVVQAAAMALFQLRFH